MTDWINDWMEDCLIYINIYRTQYNLKQIDFSKKLTMEALEHCKNMSAIDELYHHCGKNQLQNIAVGYNNFLNKPNKLIDAWYNHEGHKRVLLDSKVSYFGINFYSDKEGKCYFFTANFE